MALGAKVVLTAEDRTANAFRSVQRNTDKLEGGFDSLKGVIGGLVGAAGVGLLAKQFLDLADKSNRLRNRLKLVEDNAKALDQSYNDLFNIAQKTHTDFESAVGIYFRFSKALGESGATSDELKDITLTLSQAISLSGVSADSANAAMVQLGQGLAAGALRGEELNSVLEQTPRVAEAIAEGMGVTIGQLRKLGSEGRITAKAVMEALKNQGEAVSTEFAKMAPTVEMAMNNLTNSFGRFIGAVDRSLGLSAFFAETLKDLSETADDMTEALEAPKLQDLINQAVEIRDLRKQELEFVKATNVENKLSEATAKAIANMMKEQVDSAQQSLDLAQARVDELAKIRTANQAEERRVNLLKRQQEAAEASLEAERERLKFLRESLPFFAGFNVVLKQTLALLNDENKVTTEMQKLHTSQLDIAFARYDAEMLVLDALGKEQTIMEAQAIMAKRPLARFVQGAKDFGAAIDPGAVMAAGGASGARAKGIMDTTMEKGWEAGVMELVLSNEKVQEALSKVFDALFKLIDPIIDLLVPVLDAVGEILVEMKPLFDMLIPPIKNLIPPIISLVSIMNALVGEIINLKNMIESFDPFGEQEAGNITASPASWLKKQTGIDLGGFQHGGVSSGGPTLVGESGPELVNLPTGARVTPNNQMGGMGIVVNIFDGTGRKIDQSMSDLRVEIIDRANRFSEFSAVAA